MTRDVWAITRDMFLSEDEVAALLQHVRGQIAASDPADTTAITDSLLVELLLFSGIRNTECCRLTRGCVQSNQGHWWLHIIETSAQTRDVYLPVWLGERIRQYLLEIRPQLLMKSTLDGEAADSPLIVNERGKAYERTGLYRRILRILTAAGLEDRASVQLLRHTYGYLAYKATGGQLLFVQRQLGHAHPMVTAIYARFVDEQPGPAADVVGSAFGP